MHDKLLKILYEGDSAEDKAEAIVELFADEGYIYAPGLEIVTTKKPKEEPKIFLINDEIVMTGQAYYDRFKKGLPPGAPEPNTNYPKYFIERIEVLEAARKAAGLND